MLSTKKFFGFSKKRGTKQKEEFEFKYLRKSSNISKERSIGEGFDLISVIPEIKPFATT
jgi:hypothetical protein